MNDSFKNPELKTLLKVINRLNNKNIPYMLTGSMALNFYGHPRATNDFDFVIHIQKDDRQKLMNLFKEDFYISEEAVKDAIQREGIFNIIDNESVFKVDFIVRKTDPFSIEQFNRRLQKKLGAHIIDVISPEDLILAKLLWSQHRVSELQNRDIQNILRILKEKLDFGYLEKWASSFGILDQMKELYVNK